MSLALSKKSRLPYIVVEISNAAKIASPSDRSRFTPLHVSELVMSHWLKQITRPNLESMWEGTNQGGMFSEGFVNRLLICGPG